VLNAFNYVMWQYHLCA